MSHSVTKRNRTIRLIADPFILLMAMILLLVFLAFTAWIVIFTELELLSTESKIGLELTFVIPTIIYIGTLIFISPQWSTIIILSREGIQCCALFRKRQFFQYDNFPLIYRTSYYHGAMGVPSLGSEVVYIVLSSRRLNNVEQGNINQVKNLDGCIKIKYSRIRYEKLLTILPQEKSSQLKAVFSAYIEPDTVARRRSAIIAKQRRRQKRHR